MLIQLVTTRGTRCEVQSVVRLVNALQYCFVVRADMVEVRLPGALTEEPLLSPKGLAEVFRESIIGEFETPPTMTIVLTSYELPNVGNRGVYQEVDISVISNHLWLAAGESETFRFARHILQLGIAKLVTHTSPVRSCIAGDQAEFDCLCTDCEYELLRLGFRDGIIALKSALNTLNQLRSGGELLDGDYAAPQFGELKLAKQYVTEFRRRKVTLNGYIIAVVLHFLSDLVPFVRALNELGVNYSDIYLVAKPYPYARRDEVSHVLEEFGVNVTRALGDVTVEECARGVLRDVQTKTAICDKKLLVIEDGGYFAPILHESEFRELLDRCVGVVEQTQKGINEDKKIKNLQLPVLSVAESAFKKTYESPEIGRVAVQNISRFTPNIKLSGRNATIFGFGSVGQEIAFHLTNSFNMTVSVVDPDLSAVLRARHRRMIVAEAAKQFDELQFKTPALIVGTTGRASVTRDILERITADTVLVSTSSDQVEVDLKALASLARGRIEKVVEGKSIYTVGVDKDGPRITLLAEGYPINFYGSESLPNDTIDPIMTLLLLCGVELTLRRGWRKRIDITSVGKIVEKRKLVEKFLQYA